MAIFLSYARRDASAVRNLLGDLERAKQEAWYDRDLEGGERWWDAILEQIRGCDLFVFVLSPDSIRSRACRTELAYAVALQRPILPVQVSDVQVDLAPDPIGITHIVDYRERTSESAIALVLAVAQARRAIDLPDPLPDSPAPPVTDLGPLRDRLATEQMSFAEQSDLVGQLRRHIDNVDQHATLLALLEQFRGRSDVAAAITREFDALILAIPVSDDDWSPARRAPQRRTLSERDPDSVDLVRSLVAHIRAGQFTPIVGLGLTDSLVGPRRLLARQWARTFEFPMARHQQDDLAGVARFVSVMTNAATLRSSLDDYLRGQLMAAAPGQADVEDDLATLVRAAWDQQRSADPDEPHVVLAKLPCPIYVVAHPWDLLAEALRAEGKAPVVELCRWNHEVYDWPASVFESEPDYTPSVERPLVFHVFGRLDFPESLVLTEDDYFDFLVGVTQDRSLIPTAVKRVLADSALLLLGFGLEDWDVRVLLRTLVSQEGARKLHKYTHVAAQLDLAGGVISPARAQRYLERYFGKHREPSIDIYWGSVDEFAADLSAVWGAKR